MKKRIVAVFLACLCAICCLFGCVEKKTDEELIRERIDTFVTVYNDGDFDGVLECFDAKTRNTVKATFNVIGGLVGGLTGFSFDLSDFFSLGVAMVDGEMLSIEVEQISINDKNAIVSAQMGYANIGATSKEAVCVILVKEKDDWFIQDITDKKPISENASGVVFQNLSRGFSDGSAYVVYEKNGASYFGVMDTDGNIYGSLEGGYNYWSDMGNGASYFDFGVLMIMNADHEITAVVREYDEIVASGYGKIWIYKCEKSIDGTKHLYGLMDSEGEWVVPFTDLGMAPPSGVSSFVSMVSEDILLFNDFYSYYNHYTIYNAKMKQTIWLNYATIEAVFDSVIYVEKDHWMSEISFDGEEWLETYDYFCIYENGCHQEIEKFSDIAGGKMIIRNGEYVELVDLQSGKKTTYTDYEKEMVKSIVFDGEYGLVTLSGKDGNSYFTLIDENGTQQFEPIQYIQDVCYSDGVICYTVEYSAWSYSDRLMCSVDTKGKTLISEDRNFCIIGAFEDGIAVAMDKETQETLYIDKNGNRLFDQIRIVEFDLEKISKQFP